MQRDELMLTLRSLLVGTTLGFFAACGGPTAQAVPDDAAKAAAAAKEADGCSVPKDCYNKAALALQAKDNVKKANALGESANLAAQWIPLGNVPSLELANAPVIEA